MQGRSADRERIKIDIAIIDNDKLAISLSDPNEPTLNPYEAEARIEEHNRKYPFDPEATLSDINRETEAFQSNMNAIVEGANDKLRKLPAQ